MGKFHVQTHPAENPVTACDRTVKFSGETKLSDQIPKLAFRAVPDNKSSELAVSN